MVMPSTAQLDQDFQVTETTDHSVHSRSIPSPVEDLAREYHEAIGIPLSVLPRSGFASPCQIPSAHPFWLPERLQERLPDLTTALIERCTPEVAFVIIPLEVEEYPDYVAVGYVLTDLNRTPSELVISACQMGWNAAELRLWLKSRAPYSQQNLFERLFHSVMAGLETSVEEDLHHEIRELSGELESAFEEITLLHSLSQNLQVSTAPRSLAEMCLSKLPQMISASGWGIWIEGSQGQSDLLTHGQFPLDELKLAQLVARYEDHDWSRPLVKTRIHGSLMGRELPGVNNLILFSISEAGHRFGWLCCCNSRSGEFRGPEIRLLSSIVSILATHSRNVSLYREHDALMISFVRSLVSSLDAKDPYTRGHSERVALIARRIAEQLNVSRDDLQDIYLAGLIHDIGKIGVDDAILNKPGQLTPEEMAHIQRHPMIGYNILAGLKNLHRVLPGVRYHHEAYNGQGYPDGLSGEQIPLIARIIAVADSYDAMGSDRPYRSGMPLETLERILERGAGSQWDPDVVAAYFQAREDILQIAEGYSLESGNLLTELDACS